MIAVFLARWRPLWPVALIGLLALVLRVFYLHEIEDTPLFDVPVVDAKTYVDDARFLSGESWLGRPAPFWQPPLYPYALAILFRAFGESYYLPRMFQALIGAAVCVLTVLVGRRIFPPGIGLAAGLMAACYGPLIYFGGELLPPTLAIFLNLLLLLSLFRIPNSGLRWCLLSGLLLGLSALAVANVLLFLPFLLFWLWRQKRRVPSRRIVHQSILLLVGLLLVIAPVTLRNHLVGNDLVLISHNAGINFYIGNSPDHERTVGIRPGRDWAHLVEMPEREAGIERPSEKSRYFFSRSWEFISSQPLDYATLLLRKTYQFWHGDEIRRNLDPYFARRDSSLLSLLLWKHGLAFPFGLISPLALIGMVVFWRAPAGRTPQGRLLALFALVYMTSVLLFFVTSRYRLPALPPLLLFAGYGAHTCLLSPRRRKFLLILPLLLVLASAGAGAMDMEGEAHQHFWLGYAYEQKGMPANAIREYSTALELAPEFQDPLFNLAALYGEKQQHAEAAELYRQFLQAYPQETSVRFLLGNSFLLAHRYEEALSAYEAVAILRPDWAALQGRLGFSFLMAGQPGRAEAAYLRTLQLNPDSTLVRYQLARLYESEEDLEAAAAELRILLERAPDESEYYIRLADLLIRLEEREKETIDLAQTPLTREAEMHLRQTIHLDPNALHPRWSLGMLLARQKRYMDAIESFERILELAPQDYQAHLFLGHLYKRTGRSAEAEKQFSRYSWAEREHRLQKTAKKEFEKQLERVFGKDGQS